jgi:Spy/CpxP family protein refolding chaperone
MKKALLLVATLMISAPLMAQAQNPPDGGQPKPQGQWERGPGAPGMMHGGERMGTPMGFPFGPWWKNPEVVQKIGLTDDQSQRIDKVFQDFRAKLVDLHSNLEKQEAQLKPLVDADSPDDGAVMAQVDRVAQARIALERANASMMLAIRHVLTPDQWKKLQERSPGRRHFGERPDGPPPQKPGGDGGEI